ncbi:MAG TPA: hypothetical protein VGK59_21535 [Ohtaekwangia sp.]
MAVNSYPSKLFILTVLLCSSASVFSQQLSADSLKMKFDRYRKNVPQEKIYLQSDRPNYLAGETMWFTIYLTDGSFYQPSDLSKIAYIEILDRFNQPVLQTKIKLKDGRGNGALFLPASITSGNYQLRAYTNWMKNFDEAFFFRKTITILNTFRKIEPEATATTITRDAQFFPEGGNLVSGISNKVGFRVVDQRGVGVNFKGYLLNELNDTLVHFVPLKFGIGNFTFTPTSGHTYRALIRESSGKTTNAKLPAISEYGYTLGVVDSSSSQISINITARQPEAEIPVVYLFIHARQIIVRAEMKFLQGNKAVVTVDKKDLPEGISHITLFDAAVNPVCERLYFKRPENLLSVSLQTDQQRYISRRRVTLNLQSTVAGQTKPADLLVSVYKTDSLPSYQKNIAEYFSLTSDLKGNIENPEYYFTASTSEVQQALDNLMLTHGWRKFRWADVLNPKTPVFTYVPEYRNHIIQGIVTSEAGNPAHGILTYLASPGKTIKLYGSRSNSRGEVFYEMQNFHGNKSIVVQANPKVDSTYQVEILSPFHDLNTPQVIPPLSISTSAEKNLLDRSVAMQVQDIYYSEEQENKSRLSASVDTISFYGQADETYYLDAFTRFPVMEEVMREYVPGVLVRKRKDGFHFLVLDNVNKLIFDGTPLIMLDGVPLFDEDEIMAFDPKKIKKLEVMTRQYFIGPLVFPGVVSYTTYEGDLGGFQLQPKSIKMDYEGLQLQREFYSPRYESPAQRESRMPDQRTLLYWNPQILTGTDGKQQVEFYTSDVPGEYKIVVEGISYDGHVGTSSQTFVVNPANN